MHGPGCARTADLFALATLIVGLSCASLLNGAFSSRARAQCIDEAIRDELNARRQYRGVQERLFQKERRHELSALGGVYAADLTSSSYLVGGAYTYHLTEDFGLEASFGYTRRGLSCQDPRAPCHRPHS